MVEGGDEYGCVQYNLIKPFQLSRELLKLLVAFNLYGNNDEIKKAEGQIKEADKELGVNYLKSLDGKRPIGRFPQVVVPSVRPGLEITGPRAPLPQSPASSSESSVDPLDKAINAYFEKSGDPLGKEREEGSSPEEYEDLVQERIPSPVIIEPLRH
ncbi:unnamed protein product [Cylicocyclus nassatus]|uniref:Uncharacterized protein n=1 Tax=Cylicocyclus nassatus TaxID=53992 RepID=A0AA36H0H5_CYLNA|nr:unnamed protein product [Cylicocyclus nassatus]